MYVVTMCNVIQYFIILGQHKTSESKSNMYHFQTENIYLNFRKSSKSVSPVKLLHYLWNGCYVETELLPTGFQSPIVSYCKLIKQEDPHPTHLWLRSIARSKYQLATLKALYQHEVELTQECSVLVNDILLTVNM